MIIDYSPDSKVHGVNMGPTWGRQDPGGPRVGPMNLAIWVMLSSLKQQILFPPRVTRTICMIFTTMTIITKSYSYVRCSWMNDHRWNVGSIQWAGPPTDIARVAIKVPGHVIKSAPHLKMGHPQISSTGVPSSNEFQLLGISSDNGRQSGRQSCFRQNAIDEHSHVIYTPNKVVWNGKWVSL